MTQKFKVGDRVKALAYTDSSGKNHAEVTGLIVDSVTHMLELTKRWAESA